MGFCTPDVRSAYFCTTSSKWFRDIQKHSLEYHIPTRRDLKTTVCSHTLLVYTFIRWLKQSHKYEMWLLRFRIVKDTLQHVISDWDLLMETTWTHWDTSRGYLRPCAISAQTDIRCATLKQHGEKKTLSQNNCCKFCLSSSLISFFIVVGTSHCA